MKKEEKITVTINEDGSLDAEGFGFDGPLCLDAMEELLQGIGEVIHTRRKDEFYKSAGIRQHQQLRRDR